MKKIITILYFIIFFLISCSSNKDAVRWEGIKDNRLQIYLSEFFPLDEQVSDNKIEAIIKQKLDARASLILASHISINLVRDKISEKNDIVLNELIDNAIKTGMLINYSCSENNRCNALAEYDITELLERFDIINNK